MAFVFHLQSLPIMIYGESSGFLIRMNVQMPRQYAQIMLFIYQLY